MSIQLLPHALCHCSTSEFRHLSSVQSVQTVQSVQFLKPSLSRPPLLSSPPFRTASSLHSVQFLGGGKRRSRGEGGKGRETQITKGFFLKPLCYKQGSQKGTKLNALSGSFFLGFAKGLGFRSDLREARKIADLGLRASLENRDIRVQSQGGAGENADVSNGQEGENVVSPRGDKMGQARNSTPKILRVLRIAALALLAFTFFRPGFARAHGSHQGSLLSPSLSSNNVFASAWAGLLAGLVHTLSGPDHLAALAPLSIGRTKLESAAVGALWGCGHDVGQVLFGALFVVFRDKLHLDLLRVWGARIVGLTLMTIGGMGIYESQYQTITCAPDDEECLAQPGAVVFASDKQAFSMATFATGIVHGLQPDALLVILPALALPSKAAGASFLVMFLLGTILAMGLYTAFIGSCSDALHKRVPWLTHRLSLIASLVAITVGVGILSTDFFGFSIFG